MVVLSAGCPARAFARHPNSLAARLEVRPDVVALLPEARFRRSCECVRPCTAAHAGLDHLRDCLAQGRRQFLRTVAFVVVFFLFIQLIPERLRSLNLEAELTSPMASPTVRFLHSHAGLSPLHRHGSSGVTSLALAVLIASYWLDVWWVLAQPPPKPIPLTLAQEAQRRL